VRRAGVTYSNELKERKKKFNVHWRKSMHIHMYLLELYVVKEAVSGHHHQIARPSGHPSHVGVDRLVKGWGRALV
jgi:hypothetical protein